MTNPDKRFQAACAAMQGLIHETVYGPKTVARDAVKYADALLAKLAVIDTPIVQEPKKAREFYLSESTSILLGGVAAQLTWHVIENPTPHFLETYKYIKVREVLE